MPNQPLRGGHTQILAPWLASTPQSLLTIYAVTAAFTTYFCMYAFRKPFAAAQFSGDPQWGLEPKALLVISQIIGYTLSKYVGIKICSEAAANRRAAMLAGLICVAEVALLLFAVLPPNWRFVAIFLNGLPLGMVWGLVVAYLEGRQTSELLLAGLSCSFIVSSGVVKAVGDGLMTSYGFSEAWMPAATGAIFLLPYFLSVWLLNQIPVPTDKDVAARVVREPMNNLDRLAFVKRFLPGLVLLFILYFFLTAFRDLRDTFQKEMFVKLGYGQQPSIFAKSETWVGLGVMVPLAALNLIKNNRWGLAGAFFIMFSGSLLLGAATLLFEHERIGGLTWMVLTGLGAYLTYVPFGSVLFDRLIASTHAVGTAVFAIYVADALGYSGSVGVLLYKNFGQSGVDWLTFMRGFSYLMSGLGVICLLASFFYFWVEHLRHRHDAPPV